MGDFNAKIGQGNEDCVGKFGRGERNERGDDLIDFAVAHDFKIMNTYFQKNENKRWSWRSPNHGTRNEIDYILADKHNIVRNVDVLNQVNVGSDHRMILENLEDQTSHENDLDNLNNNIIIPLKEAAKKFQDRRPSDNSKFSEETKNPMKKRRNLKPPSTVREKIEAAELNKTIQKKQRGDLRNRTTKTIEDVTQQDRGFKAAKRKLDQGKLQFTRVLQEDGSLTTNCDGMVKRAREYYHKLYSSERPRDHLRQRENQHLSHDFPEITACEVRLLIKQMKKGKAQAPDNITLDLITDGDEPVQVSLVTIQ
ncbi:craniofacial development protein 2-like [Macrobrachium rosenbergii]|uniref:craniofacial development protein 2-like n=1 Tax=Macrobrachium rosenbergii TaxID=79674 RepID=UPI0034D65E14